MVEGCNRRMDDIVQRLELTHIACDIWSKLAPLSLISASVKWGYGVFHLINYYEDKIRNDAVSFHTGCYNKKYHRLDSL